MVVSGGFDSHVHLDRLSPDRSVAAVLAAARRVGCAGWLVPGVRPQHWGDILDLAEADGDVWAAPGLHPLAAEGWNDRIALQLRQLLEHPRVVAVGEIGLDGLLDIPMALQERVFTAQLKLAITAGKPVLIHCRRAWGRVIELLRASDAGRVGGILHAFGASSEIARQGWQLGFCCSFGGPLTYANARRRIEVLRALPQAAIVIESDAPDLAPEPHRGEENRPEWLPLVAARVAEVRGWSPAEAARITTENARRILRLP